MYKYLSNPFIKIFSVICLVVSNCFIYNIYGNKAIIFVICMLVNFPFIAGYYYILLRLKK